MRVIDLAIKDLNQIVRDWKAAGFLVVMPILFTLLFGFAFGGGGGGQEDPRMPVGFVDLDVASGFGHRLWTLMDMSEAVRPVESEDTDVDGVTESVRDAEWAAAVIVPVGYGQRLLAGDPMPLMVIVDEEDLAGSTAQREVQTAVTRLAGAVQTARFSLQAFEAQSMFGDEAARQQFLEEAVDRAIAGWDDPPLSVTTSYAIVAVEDPQYIADPNGPSHFSAGVMVQFTMAGIVGAAEVLFQERKSRALRRLLTTAISRLGIILGHYLAMFVMIFVQLVILVLFGHLALDVGYLREPLATLLMMIVLAAWAATFGLLIGVQARTAEQVIIFSLLSMLLLSGLGGAWVPLESASETFRAIGHLTPVAWAMDGLENIIVRGLGLESVLLPAGVLLAYAIVFFGLAMWRFRYESQR